MSKRNIVKGNFVFEDKLDTNEIQRTIADGTVNRTGNLVTSVVVGSRTITISRDVNDLVESWDDGEYNWDLTRDVDDNITNWEVTKL